ncbi:MAG: GNAT family N-acetyltransferase [Alphaproteobacteria bacterium]|nr:GNAT family N-acetyltransferase [Alphaproteobacteria bacterium]
MKQTIKTQRLLLRPVELSDATEIEGYFNDWEIIKWLSTAVPWPYPKGGTLNHIKDMIPLENVYMFAIVLKSSNQVIGNIRFTILKDRNTIYAERGFSLSREHHSKGYMNEASLAATKFIFNNTDAKEIRACNALENVASRKIKEKTKLCVSRNKNSKRTLPWWLYSRRNMGIKERGFSKKT